MFLSVFAVHVVIVSISATLLELRPALNGHFKSLVQSRKWVWIIVPLVLTLLLLLPTLLNRVWLSTILILLASVSQSVSFASIDAASDSYTMLLSTGFMVVCMPFLILFTWFKPQTDTDDLYEQVRQVRS